MNMDYGKWEDNMKKKEVFVMGTELWAIFFFFQRTIWIYLLLLFLYFFCFIMKGHRANKNMQLLFPKSLYSMAEDHGLLNSFSQCTSSSPVSYTKGRRCHIECPNLFCSQYLPCDPFLANNVQGEAC